MRVVREGVDVALLAVGKMVGVAEQAADRLVASGVTATVVDVRFVKPIDPGIAALVARHRVAVTIEDGTVRGGFGDAVLEQLAAERVTVPVRVLGLPDRFVEHGAQNRLLRDLGLDADGVVEAVLQAVPARDPSALAG